MNMKFNMLLFFGLAFGLSLNAQNTMTPELLWQLGRVSAQGITKDGKSVVYAVTHYSVEENKGSSKAYMIPLAGGDPVAVSDPGAYLSNHLVSPDGKSEVKVEEVKVHPIEGNEIYPDLAKADVKVYESLNYRHWDEWEDGVYNHPVLYTTKPHPVYKMPVEMRTDLLEGEPYDCPTKPFGGDEDIVWSPDGKQVLYVTKKKFGKDYAVSTNTDIYAYDVATGQTKNLTEGMMGYDVNPAYSSQGTLAWLSMKHDGYESDKNDIVVMAPSGPMNLTSRWDESVNSFIWSNDGTRLYFNAAVQGTIQLFEVDYPGLTKKLPVVRQITQGDFDITGMVGQVGNLLVISRTDMNHATELYTVDVKTGEMKQLTHVNDEVYAKLALSKVEKRWVTTTDGKKMLVYVILPPNFDASKKYPTLLYCQGGPQVALTQFYSFRWNFQLMAANGYVVVAPCRRGMPGFGVEWNAEISKDHGGQAMKDYLSAIDDVAKEPYVDNARLGCVGASYGGYSVFYLAGVHNKRFKTFIAHDGIFDLKSMYGTTEEMFFENWDLGGPYWDKSNAAAQKSFAQFDPSSMVDKWDTPIMIVQGGKDYRVPIGQGLEAFQAAQLRGIKSKLLLFPEENHWVLKVNNALVWQREFFGWLGDTLKNLP